MEGITYCTAHNYNLSELIKVFKKTYPTLLYPDAFHCQLEQGDVFFFQYGCVVFWDVPYPVRQDIMDKIAPYEIRPITPHVQDDFTFSYGRPMRVYQDEVILENEGDRLLKLAASYGFAQSAKLMIFEERVEQAIQRSGAMTQRLATTGKVALSRREIGRQIGQLFLEKSSINLESAFLDTPDFFWEYSECEPVYKLVIHDMNIKARTQSLNHKLDIIHELFQILGDAINHSSSEKLEWIIIILIMFEVILGLLHFWPSA